ncbi:ATP-binding protein [Streptomyces sp. NPDC046716]|uniref:ATP-binding protein n=1 Tax=Streptomyces sp. NPDC046716 TaxID=3157093 RepID=UPI0033D35454
MNEQTERPRRYTLRLTVGAHSARHVRRIIHRLCDDWTVPPDVADDLALGVTELLSNVVRHVPGARAEVRLLHDEEAGRVRAEVTDDGPQLPQTVPALPDPCDEHGRGLAIVAAVAAKWGVQRGEAGGEGKTVWFECRTSVVTEPSGCHSTAWDRPLASTDSPAT